MDLLQLEHFLAVVEEGTFTRAAERVSQAARELIKIVRSFNWNSKVIPTSRRSATAGSRAAAGLKSPRSA